MRARRRTGATFRANWPRWAARSTTSGRCVLTHGHSDHIGFAERIRRERRDADPRPRTRCGARPRRGSQPGKETGPVKIAPLLEFILFAATHGLLRIPRVREVSTYGDGATLDLPGSPRVILVPGHTPGSAALHFPAHDALFIGDAIATHSVTTGIDRPRIAPFNADPVQALASLARLDGLEAGYVLPGHGQTWTRGVAAALAEVRAASSAAP